MPRVASAKANASHGGVARALEQSEARFHRVVEAAPNAMVMVGPEGRIALVNAQAETMFGYTRQEMLGRPVEMLIPERFREDHPRSRAAFFARPQARQMGARLDLYGMRKDGMEFPIEIGLNPIEMDEGLMVLSAIVDISERKHREERIEATLKEKELLLGEIHHRVKNNLQVIQSLLYLQSSRISDANTIGVLIESQNRIKSMAMIHQTLYESKDFVQVDFRRFLDGLAPSLVSSYSVDPQKINLELQAEEVSIPINAAIPCGLIVNELVSNALKHAFPGDRQGRIGVELRREGDRGVLLSVKDDGVGVPEDLDLTKSPTLGFQLVSLLSEQLGGALTVSRADPTCFSLTFTVEA